MCYPCSHCGACKVKLDPAVCPMCGAAVPPGAASCPGCGFVMPLPPGQVAPAPPSAGTADAGDPPAGSQAVAEEFFGALAEIARSQPDEYVSPAPVEEDGLPRADEPGVVGSWPVAWERPEL